MGLIVSARGTPGRVTGRGAKGGIASGGAGFSQANVGGWPGLGAAAG